MGFLVVTTGRLLLPARLERQALTVAEHRMAGLEGGFDPERAPDVDELSDLAAFAGVALTREGDWLVVSTDLRGDPKWSEQAEEFYRSLSGFVQEGAVHLRAQDGSSWSYAYSPTGVERSRTQAADAQPVADPAADPGADPDAGPAATGTPPPPEPAPPPEPQSFIDYPGREQSPPVDRPTEPPAEQPWDAGTAPPPPADQPPPGPPQSYRDLQLPHDDDARPSPRGRALLMTVVLVVGVLLIIGLALLASGF